MDINLSIVTNCITNIFVTLIMCVEKYIAIMFVRHGKQFRVTGRLISGKLIALDGLNLGSIC